MFYTQFTLYNQYLYYNNSTKNATQNGIEESFARLVVKGFENSNYKLKFEDFLGGLRNRTFDLQTRLLGNMVVLEQ